MEIKFKSQISIALEELFVALERMAVHLHRAQKTLARLGRSVIDQPPKTTGESHKKGRFRKVFARLSICNRCDERRRSSGLRESESLRFIRRIGIEHQGISPSTPFFHIVKFSSFDGNGSL
jgi:hypothetical protein